MTTYNIHTSIPVPAKVEVRDPLSNLLFEKLFQTNLHLQLDFLNHLFAQSSFPLDSEIEEISFLRKEFKKIRKSTFFCDMVITSTCRTVKGYKFIVEMIKATESDGDRNRWIGYGAKELIASGADTAIGSFDGSLLPVRIVVIMGYDDNTIGVESNPLAEWCTYDTTAQKTASTILIYHFCILPRLVESNEPDSPLSAWLQLLYKYHKEQVLITKELTAGSARVQEAYHSISSVTSQEIESLYREMDNLNRLRAFLRERYIQAVEEGRQEGLRRQREENATKLLRLKRPLEEIVNISHLEESAVKRIAAEKSIEAYWDVNTNAGASASAGVSAETSVDNDKEAGLVADIDHSSAQATSLARFCQISCIRNYGVSYGHQLVV